MNVQQKLSSTGAGQLTHWVGVGGVAVGGRGGDRCMTSSQFQAEQQSRGGKAGECGEGEIRGER